MIGGEAEMDMSFAIAVEPLVRRRIMVTEEQAARELVRDYVLRQVTSLQSGCVMR
jgi:hypothetical protein